MHPLVDHLLEAGTRSGYRPNDDFNGASQLGVGRFQLTQRNGVRCSAASAYLHPARARANLHVFTDSLVMRLQWQGPRATGVSIYRYGQEETLFFEREIVLAAGAYGSPQILMLSGVGSADELTTFGIPAVVDLPVGTNLQDHPLLPMSYFTDERSLFGAFARRCGPLPGRSRPLTSNVAGWRFCQRGDERAGLPIRNGARDVLQKDCRRPSSRLDNDDDHSEADQPWQCDVALSTPDAKPRIHHTTAGHRGRSRDSDRQRPAGDGSLRAVNLAKGARPFRFRHSTQADIVAFIEQQTGTSSDIYLRDGPRRRP
jgi:hypothetical protein